MAGLSSIRPAQTPAHTTSPDQRLLQPLSSSGGVRKEVFGHGNHGVNWFKILPEIRIMAMCLVIPHIVTVHIYRFSNVGKEKMVAYYSYSWSLMQRDRHVSGVNCYYVSKGLEGIN
ncbi:NADH dehydrogenase [ubiquinone] 1 alpha subcomplex subunit 1-like [Hyaena hyaena]|uniref:NADH dehydrogenase [ubiquinone] 1 alpha subcomplex subunit 1-like n=1 Tax=Hyaena hyaena TaxID=95912 RepID=UPI0019213760|nr:NADH dehydrogenase [ubiquinone] 1 alpha subcomplex subunit 1-like [Hyaena hyaena]